MPVGQRPRDGIDLMLETARGVVRALEQTSPSPASQEALLRMKEARDILTKARAAVERMR